MTRHFLALSALLLLAPLPAAATSITFDLSMSGDQEVPVLGDPDGAASGTLTLDDVSGLVAWNFSYTNLDTPLSGMHIHVGGPGESGGFQVVLNVATSGGPGTLIGSLIHPTLSDITEILNAPNDYYVNIHNGPFGGGAVRGQVPEPSTALLLTVGLTALAARSRLGSRT